MARFREKIIRDMSQGLVTYPSSVEASKNSFSDLRNASVEQPGKLKSLPGAGPMQILVNGSLVTVPAYPAGFGFEKMFVGHKTEPVESDFVVIFGNLGGDDKFYVFPNIVAGAWVTNGGSYVSNTAIGWLDLTEAEAITVNVVTNSTNFTLTGLDNSTTNDYYNKWWIWDHNRQLMDYVLNYNSATGVLTTKFGITNIANGDDCILMRFPVFKKAATVDPFFFVDDVPFFQQVGENVVICTGAHDMNDGPDLWLGFIGNGTADQGYFDDNDLDYNGWHFDHSHPWRIVDNTIFDSSSLTNTGGSSDPFPWTSGGEIHRVGATLIYDLTNESRLRLSPQDTLDLNGTYSYAAISAADEHISFRLDVNILQYPVKLSEYVPLQGTPAIAATMAMDSGSNTTTIVDAALRDFIDDELNGWIVHNLTRSATSVVTDSVGATKTLTISPAIASQTNGDNYYIRPPHPSVWSRRIRKIRIYVSGTITTPSDQPYFFCKEVDIDDSGWSLSSGEYQWSGTILGSEYIAGQQYAAKNVMGFAETKIGANAYFQAQVGNYSIIAPIYDDSYKGFRALFSPLRLSGETAPSTFPTLNRIDVANYGIGEIKAAVEFQGRLLLFSRNTLVVAGVSGQEKGLVFEQPLRAGVVHWRALAVSKDAVFFSSQLSPLELWDGNRLADPSPGWAILDIWQALSETTKRTARLAYGRKRNYVVLKWGTLAGSNQRIFVYNVPLGTWAEYETALTYKDIAPGSNGEIFAGEDLNISEAGILHELFSSAPTEELAVTAEAQVFDEEINDVRRIRASYKSNVVVKFIAIDDTLPSTLREVETRIALPETTMTPWDEAVSLRTERAAVKLTTVASASPGLEIESFGLAVTDQEEK